MGKYKFSNTPQFISPTHKKLSKIMNSIAAGEKALATVEKLAKEETEPETFWKERKIELLDKLAELHAQAAKLEELIAA